MCREETRKVTAWSPMVVPGRLKSGVQLRVDNFEVEYSQVENLVFFSKERGAVYVFEEVTPDKP